MKANREGQKNSKNKKPLKIVKYKKSRTLAKVIMKLMLYKGIYKPEATQEILCKGSFI